jgi:hypothetical protein
MALTFDLTHKHVKAEISDFGHTHLATEVTGSFNDVTLTSGKNLFVNGGAIYLQNADSSSNGTIRTSVNPASGVLIHNYNAGKNLVLSAPQGQIVFTNDSEATYKKIWHQGNQGSGSGLDADKLDGVWVAEFPERTVSGYHVSKMFSTLNTLNELVARFNEGLTNESTMQRVYNGDLGLAYTAKGSKIDADILDSCIDRNYYMPDSCGQATIAGVDVGRLLNVCIGEPLPDGKIKMVYIGAVRADEPAELLAIFKKYNVRFFIIDAMPETRYSKKIISYMNGRGFMNFYSSDKRDLGTPNNENAVANSRTQALDAVKEFLLLNQIILPANARDIQGFYEQIGELTRVYDEKKDCYNWQGEGADHYFHSLALMILAKRYLSII